MTDFTTFVLDDSDGFLDMANNPLKLMSAGSQLQRKMDQDGLESKVMNCVVSGDCSAFREILTDELCRNSNYKQDFATILNFSESAEATCQIFPFDPNYVIDFGGSHGRKTMTDFFETYIGDR